MKDTCERIEMLLSSWLDGELSDREESRDMLDHLVRCRTCRGFYREARALEGVVIATNGTAGAEAPEAIWERIDGESAPARSWLSGWRLKAAALALVAIGVAFAASRVDWVDSRWARRAGNGEVAVELGSRPGRMTEARFIEIATEVLEADARYRHAMREVMEAVESAEQTEGGGLLAGDRDDDRARERSSDRINERGTVERRGESGGRA